MKERVKRIHLPVFSYTFVVIVTDDLEQSFNNRCGVIAESCETESWYKLMGLSCRHKTDSICFIFLTKNARVEFITHECGHAIFYLQRWICSGIEEEYFCYHQGWLSQQVYDFINLKK